MKTSHDATPETAPASSVASVIDQLRAMIVGRRLLPGVQIRQEEMAHVLGISRVPLREALRVLTTEGLLTHRPHQGYFVTRLSALELNQIHSLLEFLETELIRTIRWPTDDEVTRLRALNQRIGRAAADGDLSLVTGLYLELHITGIFQLSPLTLLLAEAQRFWTMCAPYRIFHVAADGGPTSLEQHEQLIDALAAQDRALCLRLHAQYRRETHSLALAALGDSDPLPPRLSH
ncbi:GntR family transcriptional regulator [Streptomyces sp. NPDC046909]|uniref:GntR family transcriptional regulator n=1 Tax=Streptomyces sp. NPDC046909 TaxID=3155617 RepID=UPI0033FE318E